MTQSLRDRIAALLCDPEDIETGRHAADRILTLIASETGEPPNEIKMMTIVHDGGMEAVARRGYPVMTKAFELYNRLCLDGTGEDIAENGFHSEQDWIKNASEAQERELVEACAAKIASAPCSPEATHLACLDYLTEMAQKGVGR